MAAIQVEVGNLGIKIDTLQEGIRESIGTVVRESIQASFTQQQQQDNQYQQQQRQYQNAALQPPAHVLNSTQNNYSSPSSAMTYATSNYYAALDTVGTANDSQMQQHEDPHHYATQATPPKNPAPGTSPMETGAQQL